MKQTITYPKLKAEMAKHGDKLKTIAELLGVTIATASRKLSGEIGWSIEEVEKLCDYYKKDYYELFK